MNIKLKSSISAFLLFLLSSSCFFTVDENKTSPATPDVSTVNLVLDSLTYDNTLPKNFRKTTDLSAIKDNTGLNLKGMDTLNISGSQQFSERSLPLLIKAIGTSLPITVVDLRQESHGFINGFAVSWADAKNNANVGLTRDQVISKELEQLKSIKLNVPLTFYNKPNQPIIPTKVQNEDALVKDNNISSYVRITVRDGGIPIDDMVDYFINTIKLQPKNTWLHFHCKQGIGRTGTFMIMYDMMKNYKNATADEIIKRQIALANYNEVTAKNFYNNERIGFLNDFYNYCKANGNSYKIKWSDWKQKQSTKTTSINLTYNYPCLNGCTKLSTAISCSI